MIRLKKYFYAAACCIVSGTVMANSVMASPDTDTIKAQLNQQAEQFAAMPRTDVPKTPFLFVTSEEIAAARQRAETVPWAQRIKARYVNVAESWAQRDYQYIEDVIPEWGALYVASFKWNKDPVHNKALKWRGWKDPHRVESTDGTIYPNADYPDDGNGWTNPKTGEKHYFVAVANARMMTQLNWHDIPDMANAYALTGNEVYAQRVLWLMDAIATIYPRAYEGSIDYPGNAPGKKDGGRLERPYYQAAQMVERLAQSYELVRNSPHATEKSPSNPGYSISKNIEINLLMNGADYCLRMAKGGEGASYELNNGVIDYNRAPLAVGALLGIPEWVEWSLDGPLGFKYAITNTIDINGRYYESSPRYAQHTRNLLLITARMLQRIRVPNYPDGYNAFNNQRFALFALTYFTQMQVAGRLPMFGEAGPDTGVLTKTDWHNADTLQTAADFYNSTSDADIREQALRTAALMKTSDGKNPNFANEWRLYRGIDWSADLHATDVIPQSVPGLTGNTLLFDYGTAILRQGNGHAQRAALLRFGPTLNHGQADELGLQFYAKGREFSLDPGYQQFAPHIRFGFAATTVAHNLLVVNRRNQLRYPSPGGDLQSLINGDIFSSAQIDHANAYRDQDMKLYKRRVALVGLSSDDSYLIDTFWAQGGREYDYSLHGIDKGILAVETTPKVLLRDKNEGSVLSPDINYAAEMSGGYVKSYAKSGFYFAPPGEGFGFLNNPTFYDVNAANNKVNLQWSATDKTDHQMYVTQFASDDAELITAKSPVLSGAGTLEYSLRHIKTSPEKTVRFTSVILPTEGENKIKDVQQIDAKNGDKSTFMLRISKTDSAQGDDLYFAANDGSKSYDFGDGISFQGEEAFVRLDKNGKVQSVTLAGTGHLQLPNFTMNTRPIFPKSLKVLEVQNEPLRLRVNASPEDAARLAGSLIRLHREGMARPVSLLVKGVEKASGDSWLNLDASSNVEALGTVKSVDENGAIITDSPFPRTRPYIYGYDAKTGKSMGAISQELYNGSFDGLQLVNSKTGKSALVKSLEDKRTKVLLQGADKSTFAAGDSFEIQIFAVGDELEIPVWTQATKRPSGDWEVRGSAHPQNLINNS